MQTDRPLEPAMWPLFSAQHDAGEQQASWLDDDDTPRPAPPLSGTNQVRIRSVSSQQEAIIRFVNDSELPVRAFWLDFAGNEVQYTVIEPKAQRRYKTFATHPWIIREVATGQRMMLGERMVIFGKPGITVEAVIKAPPPLSWSLSTHRFFPQEFKVLVKTLLLAHNRVRRSGNSWVLLQEQHTGTHSSPPAHSTQEQQSTSAMREGTVPKLEGDPMECEPLLSSNSTPHLANRGSLQLEPMYVCLDAICGGTCFPHAPLSHQSTSSTVLDSGSTCSAATCAPSSSWAGVDSSQYGSSRSPSPPAPAAPTAAHGPDLQQQQQQQQQAALSALCKHGHAHGQGMGVPCTLAAPQQPFVHHKQGGQGVLPESNAAHQQQQQQQLLLQSPSSVGRAAKVLGWVVDKVTKVARPMCMPWAPMLSASTQQGTQGPFWEDTLPEMSELPTHLVLHIISLMAPTNVPQCVSYGSPLACPNILPALLESDPATWPAPPPPLAAEADQPTQ